MSDDGIRLAAVPIPDRGPTFAGIRFRPLCHDPSYQGA